MKKVLVLGLHAKQGGTESYIINILRKMNLKDYDFYFLVVSEDSSEKCPIEEDISQLYGDNKKRFFYCPNKKKHYIETTKYLKQFYENNHFDLIYLNATTAANISYCRYAIDKYKTPLIVHSHRSNGKKVNHYLYRNYLNRKCVSRLSCSDVAAIWMFGNRAQDAAIIPNGIDTDRFTFNTKDREVIRQELRISPDEIVLGHVGRFVKEKNHMFFVGLAKKLGDNYRFLLIGDGELKENVIKEVESRGLMDRFIFLSAQRDIERYYCAMDMFLMPSTNEGLPIVAVEAQCEGLQCIFSTGISRQTDITKENIFLPIDDIDSWSNTILNTSKKRNEGKIRVIEAGFSSLHSSNAIRDIFESATK